ncbi:hypothetical protein CPB83DRAFT_902021 [Crepidotus variabilis]|uniref:Integral membrane protein n=1 Tax=Crepidotus variabilis TaxID=179855 RepID=A0A9P6EUJ0_9AGAR|nr:hypothetical protein CPB83DRAFT_902021 [Crepidotus variabilis]
MSWDEDDPFYASSKLFTRTWAACLILPELLAVLATVFRLRLRQKRGLLWWDDLFALTAMIMALPVFGSTYVLLANVQLSPFANRCIGLSVMVSFYSAVMSTRASWVFSIVRTIPTQSSTFRFLSALTYFFAPFLAGNLVPIMASCLKNQTWHFEYPYVCIPPLSASTFAFISSVLTDFILTFTALKLYWSIKFTKTVRRLVLIGFTARSIMIPTVVIALINRHVRQLTKYNLVTHQYLLLHFGLLFSLFACNGLIIITFIYQKRHSNDLESSNQISTLSRIPSSPSTSVELVDYKAREIRSMAARFRPRAYSELSFQGTLTDVSMDLSEVPSQESG